MKPEEIISNNCNRVATALSDMKLGMCMYYNLLGLHIKFESSKPSQSRVFSLRSPSYFIFVGLNWRCSHAHTCSTQLMAVDRNGPTLRESRRQQKNSEPQGWEWESEWEVGVRRCGPTNNNTLHSRHVYKCVCAHMCVCLPHKTSIHAYICI